MSELENLEANDLLELIPKDIVLIDVRRESEWIQSGIIEGSHLLTFFDDYGNHDLEKWLIEFEKAVESKDTKFVLICAHANRTKTIGDYLAQKLDYTQATHLEGGIALWLDLGLKTIRP